MSIVAPELPRKVRENKAVYDVERIRRDFPILHQKVHGKPLVYLDNAASTQKPQAVIDAISNYYEEYNANVHRGVHRLSEKATAAYEEVRDKVRVFLGAASSKEIVFPRGTTEAINLVAFSFGQKFVRAGDEILITHMEHHSNIVPWQLLCERSGAVLKVVPVTDAGELDMAAFSTLLGPRTKLVALTHVSNTLGTVNPVKQIIAMAHAQNVPVLLDGAQAVQHMKVDVRELDCDFYAFSGHKMYAPTGIGVLYGKEKWLDAMPPYQGGGDMIRTVSFDKTTYNALPYKFEAGTPHMAGVIGLGAAIDYLNGIGLDRIHAHEADLLAYARDRFAAIPGVRLIGAPKEQAGAFSFVMEDIHPHDIGTILDLEGIAIRTGHHCTQPLMERFGVPATARPALGLYNTRGEIDSLVQGLEKVQELMGG
jgi:cysteine desulfurase/selenocysteine lyase